MHSNVDFLQVLIHAIIALLAGIMKELNELDKRKKFSVIRLIANGAVSSFVGVTTFFLLQHFELSPYLTAFCTSIAGWMGGSIMDYFSAIMKKILASKFDIKDKD